VNKVRPREHHHDMKNPVGLLPELQNLLGIPHDWRIPLGNLPLQRNYRLHPYKIPILECFATLLRHHPDDCRRL